MFSTAALQPAPITPEGHRALQDELALLRRPVDPSEVDGLETVFELRMAREQRIAELEATLGMVDVVDPPDDGTVGVGSDVEVQISGSRDPLRYRIVGPLECDLDRMAISIQSPIGAAIVGRRAGEVVEVETPGGPRSVEILHVGGYL